MLMFFEKGEEERLPFWDAISYLFKARDFKFWVFELFLLTSGGCFVNIHTSFVKVYSFGPQKYTPEQNVRAFLFKAPKWA